MLLSLTTERLSVRFLSTLSEFLLLLSRNAELLFDAASSQPRTILSSLTLLLNPDLPSLDPEQLSDTAFLNPARIDRE